MAVADDLSLKANSMAANLDDEVNAKKSTLEASLQSAVTETNVFINPEGATDLKKPPVQAAPRQVVNPTENKIGIADSFNAVDRSALNLNLPTELKVRF